MANPNIEHAAPLPPSRAAAAKRAAAGQRAGAVGIFCNLLLFAAKLAVALVSGSLAIAADAVNNLSDASGSIISLLGFKLAARPADTQHPYGHGRYEYLAGLSVSVLILVIGVELLKSSVQKVLAPTPVAFSGALVAVLVLSIGVKAWMMAYYHRQGLVLGSQTLLAAAADSRNDVLTTTCVLAAAVISHGCGLELDGWIGLAVAGFILVSGFGLVKDTLDPLLGRAPDAAEVEEIRQRILSYPGVIGTHDLMLHDYGPGRQFASVHVEISAADDPLKSHSVVDAIEREFLREYGLSMVVHMDPVADVDSALGKLNEWLLAQLHTIHPALSLHDLCVLAGEEGRGPALEFDCAAPHTVEISDAELKRRIAGLVHRKYPGYSCRVTIDRDFAAMPHEADAGR